LGVLTSRLPPELGEQQKFPRGSGVVVDYVDPASPASDAGLTKGDILTYLNDQLIVNPEQLAVLVGTCAPNETVKLSVIRGTNPLLCNVVLGRKKEVTTRPSANIDLFWEGLDKRGTMTIGTSGGDLLRLETRHYVTVKDKTGATVFEGPVDTEADLQRIPEDYRRVLLDTVIHDKLAVTRSIGIVTKFPTGGAIMLTDTEHALDVTLEDGKGRYLVAEDNSGNVVFDGPVETAEQRAALPKDIRRKLEFIEKSLSRSNRIFVSPGEVASGGKPASTQASRPSTGTP